jgi:hypothetical protein
MDCNRPRSPETPLSRFSYHAPSSFRLPLPSGVTLTPEMSAIPAFHRGVRRNVNHPTLWRSKLRSSGGDPLEGSQADRKRWKSRRPPTPGKVAQCRSASRQKYPPYGLRPCLQQPGNTTVSSSQPDAVRSPSKRGRRCRKRLPPNQIGERRHARVQACGVG